MSTRKTAVLYFVLLAIMDRMHPKENVYIAINAENFYLVRKSHNIYTCQKDRIVFKWIGCFPRKVIFFETLVTVPVYPPQYRLSSLDVSPKAQAEVVHEVV